MGHDVTKVLLGTTKSSYKVVTSGKGSIPAGKIVRQKSDGTYSLASADGLPVGISLGVDQANAGFMSIVRNGLEVPVLLTAAFTPTLGAQVHISDTTGLAIAAGAGATGMNATYAAAAPGVVKIKGVLESDGVTEVDVAFIDMNGGL